MRWPVFLWFVCLPLSIATSVSAQQIPAPAPAPAPAPTPTPAPAPASTGGGSLEGLRWTAERQIPVEKGHIQLAGDVELQVNAQTLLSADRIDMFFDDDRVVAEGNVVFAGTEGRISAERIDYNTRTQTGTFYSAFGIMPLGAQADRKQFGNQDAEVYFFGEKIERLATKKYRITRGGFSTCTQPTPRWQLTSRSLVLNLDDYAFARNTVLSVKGVPLLYLPMIYYPIQDSQRSTGFLLPTYGQSTVRGQGISNAFFWAINRSQDATFFHDWFTRAGQGEGAEYRYIASPRSNGDLRLYRFDQSEATYASGSQTTTIPAGVSYEVNGTVNQTITRGFRAQGHVEYFTDLTNQQLYHQNIYQVSRNRRIVEAGLTGNVGPVSTSAMYQRSEIFSDANHSSVYGSTPRVTASLAPQKLFNAPIYASVNSEYAYLPSQTLANGVVTNDTSFGRLDVMPTLRVP